MSILHQIAEETRLRVEEQQRKVPTLDYQKALGGRFKKALSQKGMGFICEVKKASPSKGIIAADFPYLEIAKAYDAAGADAISVLTEPLHFKGDIAYLKEIAASVSLPVLRKDFIVDPYMIYEARSAGAEAVLLICTILSAPMLENMIRITHALGMDALVEAHTAEEVEMALGAGAKIIGVNNRDLKTFKVDLENSLTLRNLVPPETVFIAESGIKTREDIIKLENAGVNAVLIGETLMRAADKRSALNALKGQ